jgi:4-azaleucine resistance transporter AzlC
MLPLAVGVATYGLAFGLLAAQAELGALATALMGATVFAGSAQIMAVQQLVDGAGVGAAVVAGAALNLRLLLIAASLRAELRGRSWAQVLLGVHLATDETWALLHATRAAGRAAGYWYFVGGGLLLLAVWVATTAVAAGFAGHIPDPQALGLGFAFTAAFIAILRNLWRGPGDLGPWAVAIAGTLALVWLTPLPPAWALVVAGVAGAATAAVRRDG